MGCGEERHIVLIPAYKPTNELIVLADLLLKERFTLVVVNDGSGSAFDDVFARLPPEVILLSHPYNRGKGRALKTGLTYIRQNLPDCRGVVTADADGQHRPEDIKKVSESLNDQGASLVLGSRHFEGEVPLRSRFGNTLTRYVFAATSGKRLMDTQTGLCAFSADLIPDLLNVDGERYEYEMNVLLWAVRERIEIHEIKIETVYFENNASSHFNAMWDSIRIYSCILKFALSSFSAFALDFTLLLVFKSLTLGMAEAASLLISVVCARLISSLVNFLANKQLVFHDDGQIWTAALRYYTLAALILSINYLMLYLLNVLLSVPLWIAKLGVELILFALSYVAQRRFVFRKIELGGA